MRKDEQVGALLAALGLIIFILGAFLHFAEEKLEQREQTKEELRQEIYMELYNMSMEYEVDANRRYVLNRDSVFRCEVLYEELKRRKDGYYQND